MSEQADVWDERSPKAQKDHRCGECGGKIVAGEIYRRISVVFDRTASTHKQCGDCAEWFERINRASSLDDMIGVGELWDDVENCNKQKMRDAFDFIAKKRGVMTIAEREEDRKKRRQERIAEYQRIQAEGKEQG